MQSNLSKIVIVGGGSAGWLAAGLIAAKYEGRSSDQGLSVTLIESPDIKTLGVGEGTWPSMRRTLQRIGLKETDFINQCDASFKQGTEFYNWRSDSTSCYTHPFTPPMSFDDINPAEAFLTMPNDSRFDQTTCLQATLFENNQAPKQITAPEYAGAVNYGYHLDAGKFSEILKKHCIESLEVRHVSANVTSVIGKPNGDIQHLETDGAGQIEGDLFIDCSGMQGLLINQHYGIDFVDRSGCLFNNRAIAAQVPYREADAPIASCTRATAQAAGWIWDIGLPTRRGIGYVFSSNHVSDHKAEATLRSHIASNGNPDVAGHIETRTISFNPGHRAQFWHKNCVALGMAAGFIEPLEASALVLVELGASLIADELPPNRAAIDRISHRFNERFLYRWDRIIDFLKLHYVLSTRTGAYWQDHRDAQSASSTLLEAIEQWHFRPPWHHDSYHVDEMFPAASYQYILYGMGFDQSQRLPTRRGQREAIDQSLRIFQSVRKQAKTLKAAMPTNRALLQKIHQYGLGTV